MTLTLRPYQVEMVDRMVASPRLLNGDEMRLGKTPCAIVASQYFPPEWSKLVLCPAIAVAHWRAQVPVWSGDPSVWHVVSYDMWRRRLPERNPMAPNIVILDEAHRLKSPDAQRTQAVYGRKLKGAWINQADFVWALSGTFMPNHGGELWTHLHALFGLELSYRAFMQRYFYTVQTEWGEKVVGNNPATIDELRALLDRVMLRRLQRDVWGWLPRLNWNVQEITGPTSGIPETDDTEIPTATVRRLLGESKVDAAVDFLTDLVEQGRRRIWVGAYHHAVIDALCERLNARKIATASITGDTPAATAALRIRAFQEDTPPPIILVGQLDACGEAICLDHADHVVMVETSWVPGADEQFAMRAVGIDTRTIPVDILALAGTLDTALAQSKVKKRLMQSQLYPESRSVP